MKTVLTSGTLSRIADSIRAKTGITGSLLPSQMAPAIYSIGTGDAPPSSSAPAFRGHEKVSVDEDTLTAIAMAIRVKLQTEDAFTPDQMPAAIDMIEVGPPKPKTGYLRILDNRGCYFLTGISSSYGMKVEAEIKLPTGKTGRMFPFLFGGGVDRSNTDLWTGHPVASYTDKITFGPISFHTEDGVTYHSVFREGLFYINEANEFPRGVWVTAGADHTGSDEWGGVLITHTIDGVETGRKHRLDHTVGWEEASHALARIDDIPIFSASWNNGAGYLYPMPAGTCFRRLKVWRMSAGELKTVDEFTASLDDSGAPCIRNAAGQVLQKHGAAAIEFVED